MVGQAGSNGVHDADDLGRVAALVARAGLKLPPDEIAELVAAYRSDRAGLERLRQVVAAEDESVHTFRSARLEGAAS
jgi:hypothetical protein